MNRKKSKIFKKSFQEKTREDEERYHIYCSIATTEPSSDNGDLRGKKMIKEKAFQLASFTIKKKSFGPKSTIFNSKAAEITSGDFNVKAVVLEKDDFTVENVKNVIENKASAILIILDDEDFVPSRKWNLAYEHLSKYPLEMNPFSAEQPSYRR